MFSSEMTIDEFLMLLHQMEMIWLFEKLNIIVGNELKEAIGRSIKCKDCIKWAHCEYAEKPLHDTETIREYLAHLSEEQIRKAIIEILEYQ